jgi:hypothetical protein
MGGITGLIGIALCFFGAILVTEFITDDMLTAIAIFAIYSHPTIGLALVLLPVLWFTGRYAEKKLLAGDKLLLASFKYCLITNLLAWSVFGIIFIFGPLYYALGFAIPLALFFFCLLLSTFTIGLLICSTIRKRLQKKGNL